MARYSQIIIENRVIKSLIEAPKELYQAAFETDCFPDVPFVAHNARFDEGCLKAVFNAYCLRYPGYRFLDTLAASRRHFGRTLPNHQLQTVAAACAAIALKLL